MKAKKILKISSLTVVIAVIALAAVIFFILKGIAHHNELGGNKVSGKVINIDYHPNIAENGHYSFTVQDELGETHEVDATGYMNTPITPESRGETCLDIPMVKVGDRVSFFLPGSETDVRVLVTCYPKGADNFYFKVL